jgi:hypothetical protein
MIGSLYRAAREIRWNRDRRRRIAAMLERERTTRTPALDSVDAMAAQLEEIRSLPEARDLGR